MSSSKVQPPSGEKRVENSSKTFINVLVVGESGVGKSTFINCIPNYAEYKTIEEARKFELKCLIPTQGTICDENDELHVVQFGNDTNEDEEIGSSKTQRTMPCSNVQPASGETSVDNSSKTFINLLLLGETGVGKSTFINSFANYVQHETIEDARKSDLLCLIPTQFTITDENYEEEVIQFGENKNEDRGIGTSRTQSPRTYVFPLDGNRDIRLIDTPGIGDGRGAQQDNENLENILDFIGQYKYLNAICILLRPNVNRLSPYFEFCFFHLLSRLDKSAGQNIVFIFTNARATDYRPTETMPILKALLKRIEKNSPNVKIPCSIKNIFCMDNEAFSFLVAENLGYTHTPEQTRNNSFSWEISSQTCQKILDYVDGDDKENCIKPHLIRNTLSVNDVRRMISDLSKPLTEICDVIYENLFKLQERELDVAFGGQSIEEFRKKMFIPSVILQRHELEYPRTVCMSAKCIERIVVNGKVHNRYKQICCEKCYTFAYLVTEEYKGSRGLYFCGEIGWLGTCKKCECNCSEHMRTYYDVEMINVEEEDESVAQQIDSAEDQIRIQKGFIAKLKMKQSEFEAERDIINKCLAKFAYFLKTHAIAIFNDAYENYLDYLIERESSYGSKAKQNFIDKHVTLKEQYQKEKRLLKVLLQSAAEGNPREVTQNEVHDLIRQLYGLKHTGEKIKELHLAQKSMRRKTTEANTEYFHKKIIRRTANAWKTITNTVFYNPVASFRPPQDHQCGGQRQ